MPTRPHLLTRPNPIELAPKTGYACAVSDLGKALVIVGLVFVAVGLILWTGVGRSWLGRLPGDLHYSRGNFSFHFPIATCLLLSLLITLILWLFRK
jgi:hypothetical protein